MKIQLRTDFDVYLTVFDGVNMWLRKFFTKKHLTVLDRLQETDSVPKPLNSDIIIPENKINRKVSFQEHPFNLIITGVFFVAICLFLNLIIKYENAKSALTQANIHITELEAGNDELAHNITNQAVDIENLRATLAQEALAVGSLRKQLDVEQGKTAELQAQIMVVSNQSQLQSAELRYYQENLTSIEAAKTILQTQYSNALLSIENLKEDNADLAESLKRINNPRSFDSLDELRIWLEDDITDIVFSTSPAITRANALQLAALRSGYIISVCAYVINSQQYAVFNIALIGDTFFQINPYNDAITPYISGLTY
jgi:hypothetical protein